MNMKIAIRVKSDDGKDFKADLKEEETIADVQTCAVQRLNYPRPDMRFRLEDGTVPDDHAPLHTLAQNHRLLLHLHLEQEEMKAVLDQIGNIVLDGRDDIDLSDVIDDGARHGSDDHPHRLPFGFNGLSLKRGRKWRQGSKEEMATFFCPRDPNTCPRRLHRKTKDVNALTSRSYPMLVCSNPDHAAAIARSIQVGLHTYKYVFEVIIDCAVLNPETLEIGQNKVEFFGIDDPNDVTAVRVWIKRIG